MRRICGFGELTVAAARLLGARVTEHLSVAAACQRARCVDFAELLGKLVEFSISPILFASLR